MQKVLLSIFVAAGLLLVGLEAGHAQATRTFVSGVGDDANPCSRTAPCKTFPGAISKTAAGGEINVLDPGGFGGVTITKSISIIAEGVEGGVLVSGTNAIIINAGVNDNIHLRGLDIEGLGTGLAGVRIMSAASVHIAKSTIHGFRGSGGAGIFANPTSPTVRILVSESTIHENTTGILLSPSGTGQARTMLDRVIVSHNATGLKTTAQNGIIRVSNSYITHNTVKGVDDTSGAGTISSFGNNVLLENVSNGAFSTAVDLK